VFGTGSFEVVSVENPSVLAYIRCPKAGEAGSDSTSDTVLCVCNLSRFAQPAELPLQRWDGSTPIELLGRVPFPRIGELPYFVTLAPYGFYWFELIEPPSGALP
jgi:maltose alpha-D-glucosyltransferase/alpha-amylase